MTIPELSPTKRALLERRLRGQTGGPGADLTIPSRRARGSVSLSPMQQRLWFLDQFQPGEAFATIDYALRLTHPVDEHVLEGSLNALVERHETLRTSFAAPDGSPRQLIAQEARVSLPVVDLRHLSRDECEAEVLRLATEQARRPFDLTVAPLLRAALVRIGLAEHVFLLAMHHIVSDGWSMRIFFYELREAYEALATGRRPALPPLPIQYGDFAEWQQGRLEGGALDSQLEYWRRQLRDLPVLRLPLDRPRPRVQSFHGATHTAALSGELTSRLRELARQHDATLFMLLLAAFYVQLARYSGQEDLPVGTYVSGRTHTEMEPLVGFFVNVLVLRGDLRGDPTFAELIRRARTTALDAYDNQEVPFEKLVEVLDPERDPARNPLCQVAFQLFTPPASGLARAEGDDGASLVPVDRGTANFDLVLSLTEQSDGLRADFEYSTDLYEPATITRVADQYRVLLASIVEEPDAPVSKLSLLPPAERRLVVEDWNATERPYPLDVGVAARFEQQAQRTPEATAFRYADRELTYAELDRRASRLARRLCAAGLRPGDAVGVHLERSLWVPIALIAALKAGTVYLPLEPTYPRARLALMLADAGARVLITTQAGPDSPTAPGTQVVELEREADAIAALPDAFPAVEVAPTAPACAIYTSGSSGRPKGAVLSQRMILNRIEWMLEAYPLAPDEVSCQKTMLSFVDALWELLGPLLAGRPTVLLPDAALRDSEALLSELEHNGVGRAWLVPGQLRALLDGCPDAGPRLSALRLCVLGGEVVPLDLQRDFEQRVPRAKLLNSYGTSEIWDGTFYDPERDGRPVAETMPIGRPIANVRTYVLDRHMQPQPVGVPGELHIGGIGAEGGYLGSAAATADAFVEDPFAPGTEARLYRTGDLARWLPNGCLEYLGRRDAQLKLRGFRIEPAEVEAVLREQAGIRNAAVAPGGRDEPARLVAYLEGADLPPIAELRAALRSRLPEFMVPSAWVVVDALPLTPSGKVDRAALPSTGGTGLDPLAEYVAPRTDVERTLAEIWSSVLGIERVGVHDSFFDVGGHSLLGTQLVARVRTELQVDLPLRALFEGPTVAQLGAALVADPARAVTVERSAALRQRVAALSDAEVEAMLAEREAAGRR
jgi:amino acid adenylation domain-containing protein